MDESATEVPGESGGALRSKLEEALTANAELAKANRELNASVVISTGGFNYVKPTDLAEVPVEEYAARAAEIQAARATEREQIFREMAAQRGIALGDNDVAAPDPDPVVDPAIARVAQLGTLGGTPPGRVKPQPSTPDEWFDAAFDSK